VGHELKNVTSALFGTIEPQKFQADDAGKKRAG
jgi:hypothetical protein